MPLNILPEILIDTNKLVFEPFNLKLKNVVQEKESAEYSAYRFALDEMKIIFRVANITPTKVGQFVTLWKRNADGPIEPFHISDAFDLVIINVRTENDFGQFVFPKSVLAEKGIVSNSKEGKRAFRVYPPWVETTSKQAQKTQKWQTDYFLSISASEELDFKLANKLYNQDKLD